MILTIQTTTFGNIWQIFLLHILNNLIASLVVKRQVESAVIGPVGGYEFESGNNVVVDGKGAVVLDG